MKIELSDLESGYPISEEICFPYIYSTTWEHFLVIISFSNILKWHFEFQLLILGVNFKKVSNEDFVMKSLGDIWVFLLQILK